jgi:hypothetical protein
VFGTAQSKICVQLMKAACLPVVAFTSGQTLIVNLVLAAWNAGHGQRQDHCQGDTQGLQVKCTDAYVSRGIARHQLLIQETPGCNE